MDPVTLVGLVAAVLGIADITRRIVKHFTQTRRASRRASEIAAGGPEAGPTPNDGTASGGPAFPLINLPDLSQKIYGRDREAEAVLARFRGGERAVAIVAPPLFGKTALLTRILQLVTDSGRVKEAGVQGIVVLNCRDVARNFGGMARELARLCNESWEDILLMDLPPTGKAREVWNRLDAVGPVWLVFENFEEQLGGPERPEVQDLEVGAFVDLFFQRQSRHRLLLLSRYMPRLPELRPFEQIEQALAGGLDLDEAVELLRREGSDCGFDQAAQPVLEELAGRLHRMPVALKLTVEFVRYGRGEIKPEGLLGREEFQLFAAGDLENRFRRALRGLLAVLSEEAGRVLRWLAFLPEPLPREALEALAQDGWLTGTLASLHNSVLVTAEADVAGTRWYRLHPVVRELIRESESSLVSLVGEDGAGRLLRAGTAAYRRRRYLVAEACERAGEITYRALVAGGREDLREGVARAAMNRAVTLRALKRYEEALAGYDEALSIRRALVAEGRGDLREDVARAAMNRAVTLHALKRYEEALAGYDEALSIWRALVAEGRGDLREELAHTYANKHNLVKDMTGPLQALGLIEQAIQLRRALVREGYGHVREDLITALEMKASTLESLGRAEEAAACREEAKGCATGA